MSIAYVRITGTDPKYGSVKVEVACIILNKESGDWLISMKHAKTATKLIAFNATNGLLCEADIIGVKPSLLPDRIIFELANVHKISGDAPVAYRSCRWPIKIV